MSAKQLLSAMALGVGLAGMMAAPGIAGAIGSNYTFPDGSQGFDLIAVPAVQSGSPFVDPRVLVEFNPQPDPPANLRTTLSLDDPTMPAFNSPATGNQFDFRFWFLNLGSLLIPGDPNLVSPGACRVTVTDSTFPPGPCRTSLRFDATVGGVQHSFDVDLEFTNGGSNAIDQTSWVTFNPQPDPPGDGFGIQFSFAEGNPPVGDLTGPDPIMFVSLFEDGNLLSFTAVPEPGSLFLLGTGLAGLVLSRRRRRAA